MATLYEALTADIQFRLSKIKLLLMDVDGVMTNGKIRIDDLGIEAKEFSTKDGYGFHLARKYGLRTGCISGRGSKATELRCKSLHMEEIHLGKLQKLAVFEEISERTGIQFSEIAFVGDDLIDLSVLTASGVSAAPRDSHEGVLSRVDIILPQVGGDGAIRQMIDFWLMATGQWDQAMKELFNERSEHKN